MHEAFGQKRHQEGWNAMEETNVLAELLGFVGS